MAGNLTAMMPMSGRNFIDTNILIYADACDEAKKQAQAIEIITQNLLNKTGVISTQVLQEFSNVAIKKLKLPNDIIIKRIEFYSNFELVTISKEIIISAIITQKNRKIGFFDALIIESAKTSGCINLLSEDLQSGAKFEKLKIINPFAP
jgi:predicted nucleic acid-binding protein